MQQPSLFNGRRPPQIRVSLDRAFKGELVVDNFAGGGGASTGIEAAIGRPCDIAINHDPTAIAMHRANHPGTKHYCESVWKVDPREACGGRPVGLAWFSPDCTHFSRAKGQTPVKKEIRGLAWIVLRWAKTKPRVIVLENVQEFETWGPLIDTPKGLRPDPTRKGQTFRQWLGKLRAQGYEIEFTSLVAADYGAPTTRKRLFLVARRDREPIAWPERTHGEGTGRDWRPAHEIIDWSLPCPSIFDRRRPLADATQMRIAEGIRRYVIEAAEPFIIRHGHYSTITGAGWKRGCGAGTFRGQSVHDPVATICATNDKNLVVPVITKNNGKKGTSHFVVGHDVKRPLGSITSKCSQALSAAFLEKLYGTGRGADVRKPLPTITGQGNHLAEVRAFLTKYYGGGEGGTKGIAQDVREPLHTIRAKACFGLVEVHGEPYQIIDVGMRMLQPHELYAAQGFPEEYEIDAGVDDHGNALRLTKTAQIRLVGNSVSPACAEALIAAQGDLDHARVA